MCHSTQGRFQRQVSFLRQQFLRDGSLPFADVFSAEAVSEALAATGICWKDRIYSPLITLWTFLGQVLSQDHSCRAAVARLISHWISQGQTPCSSETGAYSLARMRLPEEDFSSLARQTGHSLEKSVNPEWRWKSRRVYIYDSSSVSMSTRWRTKRSIRSPPLRKLVLAFLWHELQPSSLWPVVPLSNSGFAGTRVKDRASWGCSGSYGTCFSPVTSCSPIHICVH